MLGNAMLPRATFFRNTTPPILGTFGQELIAAQSLVVSFPSEDVRAGELCLSPAQKAVVDKYQLGPQTKKEVVFTLRGVYDRDDRFQSKDFPKPTIQKFTELNLGDVNYGGLVSAGLLTHATASNYLNSVEQAADTILGERRERIIDGRFTTGLGIGMGALLLFAAIGVPYDACVVRGKPISEYLILFEGICLGPGGVLVHHLFPELSKAKKLLANAEAAQAVARKNLNELARLEPST